MDEFHRSYRINNSHERITFNELTSKPTIDVYYNEHSAEEFVKYFSIDDDDIVRLDQSQIILYEVKCVLNHIIDIILDRNKNQSLIRNQINNDEYSLTKNVRFNNFNNDQQLSSHLFISEIIDSTNELKPYTKFLFNLGFDICLKENPNENTDLTETHKQLLTNYNEIFCKKQIYSCKYCSFKTNSIHVMDHHYRTPHTVSNSTYHHKKYRCTYCLFQTFGLPHLRRHFERKHGYILAAEPSLHRYLCSFCCYETDDKSNFLKHNSRCQIEQQRTRIANNLLQPAELFNRNNNINRQLNTIKPNFNEHNKNKKQKTTSTSISSSDEVVILDNHEFNETIIIESDHDTTSISRSSSDEDFIVSSDEDGSLDHADYRDLLIKTSHTNKKIQKSTLKSKTLTIPQSFSINSISTPSTTNNLSSLSKLLLLNGTSISSVPSLPINPSKPSLTPIQPKPPAGNAVYQMCNICRCYIYKQDYVTHMKEKHDNQTIESTPLTILNDTQITGSSSTLLTTKSVPQPPPVILLISTSTMDLQSIRLDMIKCPWCDTNFEHIEIITGHLMKYHRMTLAAAKVVVAEQMKIQGTSSSQLAIMFKQEIEKIQREFNDKIYWKISQPKVYLHQFDSLSCFICKKNIDDIENHFLSSHQIQLETMNNIKQCCLCGFFFSKKTVSLFEHQLRMHSGICYSSVLKQFIRFEPPPPPLTSRTINNNNNKQSLAAAAAPPPPSSLSNRRSLTTCTEKKFGCRKCDTSSRLFTFEELIDHLRLSHKLVVKLHRRCIICQQTYLKGKEYNQHCLEHLKDENPSIKLKRQYVKK